METDSELQGNRQSEDVNGIDSIIIELGSGKPVVKTIELEENYSLQNSITKNAFVTWFVVSSIFLMIVSMTWSVWLWNNVDTDVWGDTTFTQDIYLDLYGYEIEICVDGTDCEVDQEESFSSVYKECQIEVDSDEVEEYCGPFNDLRSAGYIVTFSMLLASFMLIYALKIRTMIDDLDAVKNSNKILLSSGILIAISIVFWNMLLPDITDDMDWSSGPWLAIIAALLAIAAWYFGNKEIQ
tara:strand:+ start:3801 stop:4520 length:720 start_codon:yes stop_codon:yes gene_type:complete